MPLYLIILLILTDEMAGFWLQIRLVAWLNDHQIILSEQQTIIFDEVSVPITGWDLDGDGRNEWLLDMQQHALQGYIFVRQDDGGRYHIIWSPLAFEAYSEWGFGEEGVIPRAQWRIEHYGDVNGDQRPELAILYSYQRDDSIAAGVTGRYHILTWDDGNLRDLGDSSLAFWVNGLQSTWQWQRAGDTGPSHLWQLRFVEDNWGCRWRQSTLYTWDRRAFRQAAARQEFPKTPACYLRFAEEALRAHDYDRAISLYEKLHDAAGGDGTLSLPIEYYHARWAIALILVGEASQGIRILREVQATTEIPTQFVDTIVKAFEANPSAFSICMAVYDFIWLDPYYFWMSERADVGRTDDNIIYPRGMYAPPMASPISAGCDVPALLDALLQEHTFTTQADPTTQLAAFDIPYEATFQADLNGDGVDEWIVNLRGWRSLIFVSDDELYRVAYAGISVPDETSNEYDRLVTIQLPDTSGVAILRTRYGEVYRPMPFGYGIGAEPGECRAAGDIQILRLDEQHLTSVLLAPLCAERELPAIVDRLPVVSQVDAWAFDDHIADYVPVTYTWDSATSGYLP